MNEEHRKVFKQLQEFNTAIKDNDIKKVKELFSVDDCPDINLEIITVAPILLAAQEGYWDLVGELFELGADVDVRTTPHKWSLLQECVLRAPLYLIDSVADYCNINAQNLKGETALMTSIRIGNKEAFNCLINKEKINLKIEDIKKNNILHYAALNEEHELFMSILEKESTSLLFKKNEDGFTPIELIKDESFKLSLPVQLENISKVKKEIELPETKVKVDLEVSKENKNQEEVKVNSLSSIKKKIK